MIKVRTQDRRTIVECAGLTIIEETPTANCKYIIYAIMPDGSHNIAVGQYSSITQCMQILSEAEIWKTYRHEGRWYHMPDAIDNFR